MEHERVEFARDCEVVAIPGGERLTVPQGTVAYVTQSLGGTFTLSIPSLGGLFRLEGSNADAIGQEPMAHTSQGDEGEDLESCVWAQLRTCYDPEIPVNIVDLGLIYDLQIQDLPGGGKRVDVKMTLTAPGCGMGVYIAQDARAKILSLPEVEEAEVSLVWDPPWSPHMISPAGRQILGMD
ncbi:MAG: putative Fe-S cluster assembly protein SufT [Candidatus Binatia bacterium]|nr:MAG: putative Fe-S cluster assembly protein SufT [Candidatus Binatia bacterium]